MSISGIQGINWGVLKAAAGIFEGTANAQQSDDTTVKIRGSKFITIFEESNENPQLDLCSSGRVGPGESYDHDPVLTKTSTPAGKESIWERLALEIITKYASQSLGDKLSIKKVAEQLEKRFEGKHITDLLTWSEKRSHFFYCATYDVSWHLTMGKPVPQEIDFRITKKELMAWINGSQSAAATPVVAAAPSSLSSINAAGITPNPIKAGEESIITIPGENLPTGDKITVDLGEGVKIKSTDASDKTVLMLTVLVGPNASGSRTLTIYDDGLPVFPLHNAITISPKAKPARAKRSGAALPPPPAAVVEEEAPTRRAAPAPAAPAPSAQCKPGPALQALQRAGICPK